MYIDTPGPYYGVSLPKQLNHCAHGLSRICKFQYPSGACDKLCPFATFWPPFSKVSHIHYYFQSKFTYLARCIKFHASETISLSTLQSASRFVSRLHVLPLLICSRLNLTLIAAG